MNCLLAFYKIQLYLICFITLSKYINHKHILGVLLKEKKRIFLFLVILKLFQCKIMVQICMDSNHLSSFPMRFI